jgi:hypothetical protein
MKLGLNVIAAFCGKTPVNYESFNTAIAIICGDVDLPRRAIPKNGFVRAADVQGIKAAGNAHSFRLTHADGVWHVITSFFGGKVGSYVQIPGPNYEPWRWAEIVAPLRSKVWPMNTGSVLRPLKLNVEWNNSASVIPSVKFQEASSSISVELVRRKRRVT